MKKKQIYIYMREREMNRNHTNNVISKKLECISQAIFLKKFKSDNNLDGTTFIL